MSEPHTNLYLPGTGLFEGKIVLHCPVVRCKHSKLIGGNLCKSKTAGRL
jgi:hypothetical protein